MAEMINNEYYSQENQGPYEFFDIKDFELEFGGKISNCRIAYSTHGTLNAAKDNVILLRAKSVCCSMVNFCWCFPLFFCASTVKVKAIAKIKMLAIFLMI